MKFGGTSVGSGAMFRKVAEIVRKHAKAGNRIVVAVSAMSGVTDGLVDAAAKAGGGEHSFIPEFAGKLAERHREAAEQSVGDKVVLEQVLKELDTNISELEKVLTGISYLAELTPRSRDHVLSFGERLSAPILCGAIQSQGLKSKSFTGWEAGVVTDNRFGEAKPLMNVTAQQVKQKLRPLMDEGVVPVVTGFIAATQNGVITTLGRGGSDYTATILGVALDVDEVWIWSDVDGLMTADPKIEPSARTIPVISFAEATELAYFGAKVVYPKCLEPTAERGIPVWIKNTFNPEASGTQIVREQKVKPEDIVKAITTITDVALITVAGAGMMGTPGVAAKVFSIMGEKDVNVLMISQSSSEANISFIVPKRSLDTAINALELALLGSNMAREVHSDRGICVIAAVGAGMRGTPGVAAKVFQAVAREGVNVRMIAQGSSELNISFVVSESDGDKAVRALHKEFNLASA